MSSDKSEEEEHEVVSKQIVDYYKKYSQNRHLPKYFSGTSLSYMPPIVKDEELTTKSQPTIIIDETHTETLTEKQELEEPAKAVSPTSSITSNRKLEWDNGADIGYDNCNKSTKLYKSSSLPILLGSVDTKQDKTAPTKLSSQIVTIISYSSGDDVNDKPTQSSSSSSPSYPAKVPIESSSSSAKTDIKPVSSSSSSFISTLAFLKSKIGSPDANSTPKVNSEIQKIYSDTPFAPKVKNGNIKKRVINLCVTKPIVVQCFDKQKKKGSDKNVQTSLVEGLSKCVQTGNSLEILPQESVHKNSLKVIENQSIILVNYDSDTDKRTCSSNTQTDAEIIASQCDSFEYYQNNDKADNLKRSSVSTDSSKDTPLLGQLIREKQSKSLIGDVDKSIEILQKLLKSKKYDAVTKKRYIKKIVEKIVETKYNEDSTTSSELFIPKKQNGHVQQKLEENIPWHPPQISKFTIKTFSDEFLPVGEAEKNPVFSMNQPQDASSSLNTEANGSSLEKHENISSGSYHSWKDAKTLSERILEDKQKGQGDHLVKFAMKERQHQISWINDEISHLTKLKGLLEKKVQRTTTVYMVSQHLNKSDESCNCSDSLSNPSRNYVIQTELSSSSSSDIPVNYHLCDKLGKKDFRVTELCGKPEQTNIHKQVVGNIEVVSDDKTTHINVKAKRLDAGNREGVKLKPPALIGMGKYETFPRSRADEDKCWPCGKLKPRGASPPQGLANKEKYSFEVPLNSRINLSDKVNDIVKKYTTATLFNGVNKCDCACKCMKTIREAFRDRKENPEDVAHMDTGIEEKNSLESVSKYKYKEQKTSNTQLPKTDYSDAVCYGRGKNTAMTKCRSDCKCMKSIRDAFRDRNENPEDVARLDKGTEEKNSLESAGKYKYKEQKTSNLELPKTDDSDAVCYCRGKNSVMTKCRSDCKCMKTVRDASRDRNENPEGVAHLDTGIEKKNSSDSASKYKYKGQKPSNTELPKTDAVCYCRGKNTLMTKLPRRDALPKIDESDAVCCGRCNNIVMTKPSTENALQTGGSNAVYGCRCKTKPSTGDALPKTDDSDGANYGRDNNKLRPKLSTEDALPKTDDSDGTYYDRDNNTVRPKLSTEDALPKTDDSDGTYYDRDNNILRPKLSTEVTLPKTDDSDAVYYDRDNKLSTDDALPKTEDSDTAYCCRCKNRVVAKLPMEDTLTKTDESDAVCGCRCKNIVVAKLPMEDARSQTVACCCNREVQTDGYGQDESTGTLSDHAQTTSHSSSTSSSSGTVSSTTESVRSCICCKRQNVTSKRLYNLKKKLSDQAYPLCRPCYRQNRKGVYPSNFYSNPEHICNCYTVVQTRTLNEIKKTINDLNELDEYCTCIKANDRNSSDYCKHCKCKLKETSKNKNGIAYMLTFENEYRKEKEKKKKHKKEPYLEEIKIRIPVYKKKHKDKENKRKKAKHHDDDAESSTSGVQKKNAYNLQEFLKKNRPDFVEDAEGRRRTVNDSRAIREEMSEYNKLLFLKKCQEECEKQTNRLFSAKEMKEITRRNYKKLPEVQQKLNDNRDRQLRQASRLMADTFNKKLRENVLKGRKDLPSDVVVINM